MRVPSYDIVMMAKVKMMKAVVEKSAAAFVMGRRWLYAKETQKTVRISRLS